MPFFVKIIKNGSQFVGLKNSMSFEFKLPYVNIINSGFKRNVCSEIKSTFEKSDFKLIQFLLSKPILNLFSSVY